MSSAGPPIPPRISPDEYLALERGAAVKSEYLAGAVVAMAGGTSAHSRLALRLGGILDRAASKRGCTAFNSDMKVWVESTATFLYPDISGLCDTPAFRDGTRDVLLNPSFIVEVLSKSTEAYDRGRKLAFYMGQPSIVEIALVSQSEPRVDKYTRQSDGIWRFDGFTGADAVVPFVSIGCEVRLGDFYEGIELEPV